MVVERNKMWFICVLRISIYLGNFNFIIMIFYYNFKDGWGMWEDPFKVGKFSIFPFLFNSVLITHNNISVWLSVNCTFSVLQYWKFSHSLGRNKLIYVDVDGGHGKIIYYSFLDEINWKCATFKIKFLGPKTSSEHRASPWILYVY